MKKLMAIGISLSIALFIIGLITSRDFFLLTIPHNGIIYVIDSMTPVITDLFLYSLTLSLIPICCILVWKKARITSIKGRILTIILLLAFIVAGGLLGYLITLTRGNKLKTSISKDSNDHTEIIGKSQVENYMFLGLMAGTVARYFLFRHRVDVPPKDR